MDIREYLKNNILVLDGSMGSVLMSRGLSAGELPESWNLSHPDIVESIHRDYYDAGANVVLTNTFGANILKHSPEELGKIISAALDNAKRAKHASVSNKEKWIALDVGPTGKMLKPLGELEFEEAVEIFKKTIRLGVRCGAELIFIETMSDTYETKAAVLAAKEECDLPIFVSNSYSEGGKLLTGADAAAVVAMLEGLGVDAIGVNCSFGPSELAPVVKGYLACSSLPVILKANAGMPHEKDGAAVYDIDAETFSKETLALVLDGVRVVGGCCGTTPAHIRALSGICCGLTPAPITEKHVCAVSSYTHAVHFDDVPVLIGERINPTGKAKFKEALRQRDLDYILKEGIAQENAGVDILDVNVGLPEIDEIEMLTEAVTALQAVTDLPLQIDTSDAAAMEAALRIYNGKAMINSVNGKEESMKSVFPLAKKYGGVVVALTLDENGIPETAEGRVAIAERILERAGEFGVSADDIIFDPLALTVSADKNAAIETLRAVKMIKDKLGARSSLGVSNVSFGLPCRDIVNSTFFTLAMNAGLGAAIINPYSREMMSAYRAYLALNAKDENFADYISYAKDLAPIAQSTTVKGVGASETCTTLSEIIEKGLKNKAAELTREALSSRAPLDIINEDIVPALDRVGVGFENKTIYLPQLLMSAEAAGAAFDVIKANMSSKDEKKHECRIILATVKGDIHDIGKNIVKLLLQNYGYEVVDLGRDVPAERIVDAAIKENAAIVGLSALMTTTVPEMEKTVALLRKEAPRCKIMVGGAVLTEEYSNRMGADKYARDAMEAVRYAQSLEQ